MSNKNNHKLTENDIKKASPPVIVSILVVFSIEVSRG